MARELEPHLERLKSDIGMLLQSAYVKDGASSVAVRSTRSSGTERPRPRPDCRRPSRYSYSSFGSCLFVQIIFQQSFQHIWCEGLNDIDAEISWLMPGCSGLATWTQFHCRIAPDGIAWLLREVHAECQAELPRGGPGKGGADDIRRSGCRLRWLRVGAKTGPV